MVVDIVTGEARVLPSLSDTVYSDGKPPADEPAVPVLEREVVQDLTTSY